MQVRYLKSGHVRFLSDPSQFIIRCSFCPSPSSLQSELLTGRATDSGFEPWLKNVFAPHPHPTRWDRLNIFTQNQKDGLSVAERLGLGLQGLICTIEKCDYREIKKKIHNIVGPRVPFPDSQAPLICTGFPLIGAADGIVKQTINV